MQKTWVRSLGWEDLLKKEMATHSSILTWIIPWMEEPGRPQSMRLDATEGLTFSLSAGDGLCVNALDGRKCPFYLGAVRL